MFWQLLLTITIGAFIGAFTNQIAILMLFRPYKSWKIGRIKIPFTPGVIPKRQEELANKIGEMVESYLLTPEGIIRYVRTQNYVDFLTTLILQKVNDYIANGDHIEVMQENLRSYLNKNPNLLTELTWQELIPNWEKLNGKLSSFIAKKAVSWTKEFINSTQGEYFIKEEIDQFIKQNKFGLFLGFLSDNQLIIKKMQNRLLNLLDQEKSFLLLNFFLKEEFSKIGKKTLAETLKLIPEEVIESYLKIDLLQALSTNQAKIEKGVRFLVMKFFSISENNLTKVLKLISIKEIVTQEILRFPLKRLEKLIIEVSGHELKMITLFGGLLGGFIGLVQYFLIFFLNK